MQQGGASPRHQPRPSVSSPLAQPRTQQQLVASPSHDNMRARSRGWRVRARARRRQAVYSASTTGEEGPARASSPSGSEGDDGGSEGEHDGDAEALRRRASLPGGGGGGARAWARPGAAEGPYGVEALLRVFRFLVGSVNPRNPLADRVLGLSLLRVVLETAGRSLGAVPELTAVVKDDLCKHLLQNVYSSAGGLAAGQPAARQGWGGGAAAERERAKVRSLSSL